MYKITNKRIEKFISCLLSSWGGDTPDEAVWALDDFLKYLAEEHNTDVRYEYPELDQWPDDESIDPYELLTNEINRILAC